MSTKEIRFGDFSDVMNPHYIFKEFKYYTEDAVEPYTINNIDPNTVNVSSLSAYDAKVNNYGDTWIVGPNGIFYYNANYNKLLTVGPEGDIPGIYGVNSQSSEISISDEQKALKKFRVVVFDNYNNIYFGGEDGVIRYSTNHMNGLKTLNINVGATITSIAFDKDNIMYVGTETGLYSYTVSIDNTAAIDTLGNIIATETSPSSYLLSIKITSIQVDVNNCIWIGTNGNGVYSL
jgi:hypothetical protein